MSISGRYASSGRLHGFAMRVEGRRKNVDTNHYKKRLLAMERQLLIRLERVGEQARNWRMTQSVMWATRVSKIKGRSRSLLKRMPTQRR